MLPALIGAILGALSFLIAAVIKAAKQFYHDSKRKVRSSSTDALAV
tara:strand:- start:436 stop:573 length:138 start_codon:yes stop_codon:yes gene_type:complete